MGLLSGLAARLRIGIVIVPMLLSIGCPDALASPRSDLAQPAQLHGLRLVELTDRSSQDKSAIELAFDQPSADRLREFTSQHVGQRVVFFAAGRKLATLKLRDAISEGRALLTGDFTKSLVDSLVQSPPATIDLELAK
jgi:hypothetical protein